MEMPYGDVWTDNLAKVPTDSQNELLKELWTIWGEHSEVLDTQRIVQKFGHESGWA